MSISSIEFTKLSKKYKNIGLFIALIFMLFVFHTIYYDFFPSSNDTLGHDYGYFMPRLLDGYIWYHYNGITQLQWFTPSFCGGVPVFANPQSPSLSFAQLFFNVLGPITGIYTTVLFFAVVGFIGMYLLLKKCFEIDTSLSFLGASLFMFNGFFVYRMLIGHLSFHSFMLIPLFTYFILYKQFHRNLPASIGAAIILSYVFVSGNINGMLPIVFSAFIITLSYRFVFVEQAHVYVRWLLSAGITLLFCSAKLVAVLSFLQNVDRSSIPIPGMESVMQSFQLAIASLFLYPMEELGTQLLVNKTYHLGRHEYEYGISIIPVILVLVSLIVWLKKRRTNNSYSSGLYVKIYSVCALVVCFSIPLLLNYYNPQWHALIKQLPVLGHSSNLLRWYSVYIPCFILLPLLIFNRIIASYNYKYLTTVTGIIFLLITQISVDRDYYINQPYHPQEIVTYYNKVKKYKAHPVIEKIVTPLDHRSMQIIERDNALIFGGSQLQCYEPMFGYQLKNFPLKSLRSGSAIDSQNGQLNVKNPVCFVYPETNKCLAGDHFLTSQKEQASLFLRYKNFVYEIPLVQVVANYVTIGAVLLCLIYLFIIFVYKLYVILRSTKSSHIQNDVT